MKTKIFIGTIVLLIGMLVGFSISNFLFKPKPIVIVEYEYLPIPWESIVDSLNFNFVWDVNYDTSYIDTKLIKIYKTIYDTIQTGYIPVASDTMYFHTGDSLYTEYQFPSTLHNYGKFNYLFFPRSDSTIIIVNTEHLKPKLTFSPFVQYQLDNSINIGIGLVFNGYGVIGNYNINRGRYGIGITKYFNFF